MNLIYRTLAVFFLFQDGGKGGALTLFHWIKSDKLFVV